jgi:polyhydroxybutyrate depolymerase
MRLPLTLALTLVALLATRASAGTFLRDQTLVHDGTTRWFDVYVPDEPATPSPLVVVLHGGTQSNDVLESGAMLELRRLADEDGAVLALPNGTSSATGASGPSGSFNWNDCRSDAGPAATVADDVGFVARMIDEIAMGRPIDAERVYVVGASNGGMMAYRLALELSHRIAAVAAAIANLPLNGECRAAPEEPLSVLIMNGTADPIMPWAGGQVAGNRGLVASAEATRDFWIDALGVDASPRRTEFPDLDPADGSTVALDLYANGAEGSELAFYTVTGGGHTTPSIAYPGGARNRDLEAAHEMWGFLAGKRLSGAPPAERTSGLQITPDGKQTLISKDVAGERWTITYEQASGRATGNVFATDGGPPKFVACARIAANPSSARITFACRVADPCTAAPCGPGGWLPVDDVMLPVTFFLPPFAGD